MAELTRHRMASFCIESQRFVTMHGEVVYVQPLFCRFDEEADRIWRDSMEQAEQSYHTLREIGCRAEDARKVLPNSTATRMVMKANLREWRHIFALRTSKAAYPETQQ